MKALLALGLAAGLLAAGCSDADNQSAGVYVLVNFADNHHRQPIEEIETARKTIDYLLQHLAPSDTLAAANIGSAGFSATDIIAAETFSQRPSVVNDEKRAFRDRFDHYAKSADGSLFSDICGGMLQAIEALNRSEAARKTILILSNLKEKPAIGTAPDLPLQMTGYTVAVLKTHGLQPGSRDLKLYLRRVEYLRRKVEAANARFRIIEDLHQLKEVL